MSPVERVEWQQIFDTRLGCLGCVQDEEVDPIHTKMAEEEATQHIIELRDTCVDRTVFMFFGIPIDEYQPNPYLKILFGNELIRRGIELYNFPYMPPLPLPGEEDDSEPPLDV